MSDKKSPTVSPEALSKRLGLSVRMVHKLIRKGELRAYDLALNLGVRPRWRIEEAAVEEFLKSRLVQPEVDTPVRRRQKANPSIKIFV
jgi:excisionase family DNA binding protein